MGIQERGFELSAAVRRQLPEYEQALQRVIIERYPSARTDWLKARAERTHHVLPFNKGPYDVVFVNTPSTFEQGAIPTGEEPPIGLLRVAQAVREAGFNAGVLDAHALNLTGEQIQKELECAQARIIAINPTSVNVPEGKAVAEIATTLGIPYLLGGIHATLDPAIARRNFPEALAIVRGDGEDVAPKLVAHKLRGGTAPRQGVYYCHDIFLTGSHHDYAPKVPIEQIPFLRQDQLVEFPLTLQSIPIDGKKEQRVEGSLYSTRGCPFECGFCASPVMVGRGEKGVRPYDHPGMERVVDEVAYMLGMGADAIHFLDDMVIVHQRDIDAFHAITKERGLQGKFVWRGMTRAPVVARDSFNDETLDKLVESGCWRITLGVESGSNRVLQYIRKQITTQEIETAVKKLVSRGIQVKAFFIMGFPTETEQEIRETYEFVMRLKALGLGDISAFQFKPYPGTALWEAVKVQHPEALRHLDYVGGDARRIEEGKRAFQGVWLPDDLEIASGPKSGQVKSMVLKTIHDFYGGLERPTVGARCSV